MINLKQNSFNAQAKGNWALAFILLLTIVSYWPTFYNGFQMGWDDQWMVMNAHTVGQFNEERLRESFLKGISGQYDPLNQLMYSLLYRIDGYNSMIFHAASLLFHLCNTLCVYLLMRKILCDCTSLTLKRIRWITFITTLFFAIHPLQVESIAWISASKIVLSTLFYLLASMAFVRFLNTGCRVAYPLTLLLFVLSYMCKEAVVCFPLWATLLCVWYGLTPHMSRFWLYLIPLYIIALLMGLHLVFVVTSYNQYLRGDTYVWWERAVFCFYALVTYIFKWMVPMNLSWMYQYPAPRGEALPLWILPYPLLFCMVVYALWGWIRNRYVGAALLFSLIHLLFVLHLTALPRGAVIADRYMYLPLIGPSSIIAYVLTLPTLIEKCRKTVVSGLAVLMFLYAGLSYHRTKDWADSPTLKKVNKVIDNNSVN